MTRLQVRPRGRRFSSSPHRSMAAAGALWIATGCAASVKQAAETATPAVVEGAIEEVEQPSTRDAVATILSDPDIRAASSQLSRALTQGVVQGMKSEVDLAEIEGLTEALVRSFGASIAKSIAQDVAPQVSAAVSQVVDQSLERALSAETEARLQAVVSSVTRATLAGAGDAMSTLAAEGGPSLRKSVAQLTHDVAYSGALGVDHAVYDAQTAPPGSDVRPSVLAGLGTLARWARIVPPVAMGAAALCGVGLVVALVWALTVLRRQRRLLADQTERLRSYVQKHAQPLGGVPRPTRPSRA